MKQRNSLELTHAPLLGLFTLFLEFCIRVLTISTGIEVIVVTNPETKLA